MIEYPKTNNFQGAVFIGNWKGTSIPIYDVPNMHALNQLVGYVKLKNAGNGTVLYRGQCELYPKVCPSIKHELEKLKYNEERLEAAINAISNDDAFLKFFGLKNDEIRGWELYRRLVIEAALQHYGAQTYSVDFVDNHWTALWFGLYAWNEKQKKYVIRKNTGKLENEENVSISENFIKKEFPSEPTIETIKIDDKSLKKLKKHADNGTVALEELMCNSKRSILLKEKAKWKCECKKIKDYNDNIDKLEKADLLFLFLYVADTNTSNIHGIYIGENSYTIDLRKVLPSIFLRPSSQHGWIVRGKRKDYDFNDDIACVVRIDIEEAKRMLGNGTLLSQENFFPNESIDQGYRVLLERQKASRLTTQHSKVLPPQMITDFQ